MDFEKLPLESRREIVATASGEVRLGPKNKHSPSGWERLVEVDSKLPHLLGLYLASPRLRRKSTSVLSLDRKGFWRVAA